MSSHESKSKGHHHHHIHLPKVHHKREKDHKKEESFDAESLSTHDDTTTSSPLPLDSSPPLREMSAVLSVNVMQLIAAKPKKQLLTVRRNTPLKEAYSMMVLNNVSRLPVVDHNKKLVGVVTKRSLRATVGLSQVPCNSKDEADNHDGSRGGLAELLANLREIPPLQLENKTVKDNMVKDNLASVSSDATIVEACTVMRARDIGGLPVLDASSGVVLGVVTRSDIIDIMIGRIRLSG